MGIRAGRCRVIRPLGHSLLSDRKGGLGCWGVQATRCRVGMARPPGCKAAWARGRQGEGSEEERAASAEGRGRKRGLGEGDEKRIEEKEKKKRDCGYFILFIYHEELFCQTFYKNNFNSTGGGEAKKEDAPLV